MTAPAGLFIPRNPIHSRFRTGAYPTSRHKLACAIPFPHRPVIKARSIIVPSFLEMWLNDVDGDCVTAEEAAAIAFYSVMLGLPEIKITDTTVLAFCNKFGFLNGANLTDVMDKMSSDGFVQDNGYKDGPYQSVDYSNESALQSALEQGPVKIGIDSTALPPGAGNANGWYASGGSPGQYASEDHCVGLWNYGNSSVLFSALGVSPPSGFPSTGYHLYTWSTVGVVDHAWIMSTCGEAWIRNPTDISFGPGPTPPPPLPPPSTLQQQIDNLLAGLEHQFARNARVLKALQGLQMAIDRLFASSKHNPRKMKAAALPPAIIQIIDAAFVEAAQQFPQFAAELNGLKALVDTMLPWL